MNKSIMWVLIGGAIGSVLRYVCAQYLTSISLMKFPFSTLFINVFGCFMIGLIYTNWNTHASFDTIKTFLMIGVLGGFTTFSTFGLDTVLMIKDGLIVNAILYILSSVILGVLATYLGFMCVWR